MLSKFLISKFVKNSEDVNNKKVREAYGYLGGLVGIIVNLVLFTTKLIIGIISNSIAITADAFNNLSDVASSVITILGFKLASKPPDKEHPFGHGRLEYISGLIVSFLVILVGFEFIKTSFDRVIHPSKVIFKLIPFVLILASIGFKLWISGFNKTMGKAIKSSALEASSTDALSDVVSSSCVALSLLLSIWIDLPIDGYIGILVSFIIIYAGYKLIRETMNPLLGEAPDKDLVNGLKEKLLTYDHITGAHDLVIHNYGPGRCMGSIHAEVPCDISIVKIHEIIDTAEKEISEEFNIYLVIHMDPINTDDEDVNASRLELLDVLKSFSIIKSIHDFRIVGEGEHKNLIFDAVIDFNPSFTDVDGLNLEDEINKELKKCYPNYNAIMTLDRDYLGVQ
ncbi:cation diffusion facilitator family transporter [Clostridium sp. CM028]|uniref:cation diffusion facilitator family transporter n=1 Tax=unclassified Clostridium TaxID=2614128 RepID=UPI001C6DFBCF|nr:MULTISPECIES: cation diffusion facilitator family transporter [unclassified Clostridium]MBW9144671.1 cation diffusion facilitator family transporter [Clostridium sp. CM027]MBW9147803.1 cation diffusion facilitator family transporter [Clostridium sp. CM028]UVE40576.1 cation diffusion facilitator family transporter [Clostridium sp. CM027]WLC61246.1 cation diffusion facilitator family transporter [Clostridium sp. CM028]